MTITEILALKNGQTKIYELAIAGLLIDGEYHKQWFLEEIIKACGDGIGTVLAALKIEGYDFERGIAP
jgi:hypothetical protein